MSTSLAIAAATNALRFLLEEGIHTYDIFEEGKSKQKVGTEEFAAVVDWSGLPSSLVVDARWYDSFGGLVGRIGPSTSAHLGDSSIVPVITPPGLHHNLPGRYTFVVERFQGGVPVEVLARRFVQVES